MRRIWLKIVLSARLLGGGFLGDLV